MKHERIRRFNTRDVYPNQNLDNDMCMVVKAGNRIFMRGQMGLDLDQRLVSEDPAAQADQAMQNVRDLLEEAGSSLDHICQVTTYITDRAYREPVYNTVNRYLKDGFALSDGAQEAFLANKQAMLAASRFYPGDASPPTLTAPFGNFAFVCQAFVILILLGEMAIAAAFAFFRSPWIRHGALFPFALTLGVVRSEFVFASILCLFGLSQCEPSQAGLRRAYALLAVVLAASIFFTPIELHP